MYTPKPVDTSKIELSEDLYNLVETLAENAHDTWAKQRMSEGWRLGPGRDEKQKMHPDLVPYKDLPESEKEYDRKMAVATIKVILLSGYRIERT